MAHVRRQLREQTVTQVTGLATTGANAFDSPADPIPENKLPAVRVFTSEGTETVVNSTTIGFPCRQKRTLPILIEGVAAVTADLDDVLDGIALEVEKAMGATVLAFTLNNLAREGVALDRIETARSVEGELDVGVVRLHYEAIYFTNSNAPDVAV